MLSTSGSVCWKQELSARASSLVSPPVTNWRRWLYSCLIHVRLMDCSQVNVLFCACVFWPSHVFELMCIISAIVPMCRHGTPSPRDDIGYLFPVFPCSQTHPAIGWSSVQTRLYGTHSRKLWTSMTLNCLVRSLTQTHLAAFLLPSVIDIHTTVYTHTAWHADAHTNGLHREAQWLAVLTRTPFSRQR